MGDGGQGGTGGHMNIRPYRQGDEEGILILDDKLFSSKWNPRTLENWHWKFTGSNPAGHALVWVAEHQGEIVGHFAAVPYRLKVFDREIMASHTIGAMVDERFQNRGLLKFINDRLVENLIQYDINYTWAFPNEQGYRFETKALGGQDLINFDVWKWTRGENNQALFMTDVKTLSAFDTGVDRLWESCRNQYEIAVVRKKEYLNWRYLSRPDQKYFPMALYENNLMKGYVVAKLFTEGRTLRGHVVDLFAPKDDEKSLRSLLSGGMHFLKKKKVDEVTIWFWGNPLVEKIMMEVGFVKETADIPLIMKVNRTDEKTDRVLHKSHWYFTMGDSTEIF